MNSINSKKYQTLLPQEMNAIFGGKKTWVHTGTSYFRVACPEGTDPRTICVGSMELWTQYDKNNNVIGTKEISDYI